MTMTEDKERTRLFLLDETLRKEADNILDSSGIGKIILKYGFHPAGAYAMKTMSWRDIDFERTDDDPDPNEHWEIGKEIGQLEWVWNLHCNNAYNDPENPDNTGLYWGIKVSDPESEHVWRVDLWTARLEEFEKNSPNRSLWYSRLNDETRFVILSIKDKLKNLPEMRRTFLSAYVYEAVLGSGIRDMKGYLKWWEKRFGKLEEKIPV